MHHYTTCIIPHHFYQASVTSPLPSSSATTQILSSLHHFHHANYNTNVCPKKNLRMFMQGCKKCTCRANQKIYTTSILVDHPSIPFRVCVCVRVRVCMRTCVLCVCFRGYIRRSLFPGASCGTMQWWRDHRRVGSIGHSFIMHVLDQVT